MATQLEEQIRPTRKETPPPPQKPVVTDRSLALDAYRGFVMLAMISAGLGMKKLLGDPTWGWLADQFQHREWEGCTFWDLIQPSFMFLVGASMPFAFAKRRERGEPWSRQLLHAARRSLLLIAIGVFLDVYAEQVFFVQFIRVLQQIAIGYFVAFLVIHLGPRVQAATAVGLLVAHTLAYLVYGWVNGTDPWDPGQNVGVSLDQLLHLKLSQGHYVTFNAVSSAATILFGVLCGELLRSGLRAWQKLFILFAAGVGGLVVGLALRPMVPTANPLSWAPVEDGPLWIPLVKRIWTTSFALYAAGWTCLMMFAFYGIIEVLGWRRWTFPLVVVGMNSIAAYVIAGVFGGDIKRALQPFQAVPPAFLPEAAPVVLSLLTLVVVWLALYWLYRHRIFFKV
jgi:heparan-alpha-glucosaminide N-acetyltransferase